MKRKRAFLDLVIRRLERAGRHHISRLPEYPTLPPPIHGKWRPAPNAHSTDAKRQPASAIRSTTSRLKLHFALAQIAMALLSLLPGGQSIAAVREVGGIGLTVGSLQRELMFYTNTLPFELISIAEARGPAQDKLLDLPDVHLRVATLKLGDERITLTEHPGEPGKPIPADSRSQDHWFQHIAIVVSDMDKAYEHLHRQHVKHVSTAPQTLPVWNTNAAGIKAFYFRDPENHVLEIINFPPGKGDPRWQGGHNARVFLGIDHTAIVVSDTDASLAFYRDLLGMRVAGESENWGVEQEHLNQVFGARVRITALRAPKGPGIEFLEYLAPPGGRPMPEGAKANDLIFWRTNLRLNHLEALESKFQKSHVAQVSRQTVNLPDESAPSRTVIIRDPDGHALQLMDASMADPISAQR